MTEMRDQACVAAEFDGLLMPLLGPAYGMSYHMLGNREEAEDCVQEAAVLAFRAFASFRTGTNFKAWFFQILVNCVRQNCRKRKRAPEIIPIDDAPDLYLYIQSANAGLLERHSNPAALVISKMTEEQIHTAIAALPEEYRVVSVLYFVEELAYQEIADILECPVGTVRSRLHRGRKLLQKALWQVAQEEKIVADLCAEKEKLIK
jgi:RNA polymerase sigma-70 factor (ECF subfamily)